MNWEPQGITQNQLLHAELAYDAADLLLDVEDRRDRFNAEQHDVFDRIMQSVQENHGECFFVHSGGGGGKTFLCNTIASAVQAQGKVALCVASSGIASLLLVGGRTAHSRFHIPIPIFESLTCRIPK
ncbi:hypothetical protein PISMIDRAFT_107636 [Pisolithus microcarpus 441]|uniref:ATP-dependent DNA helicase n=1 Tax=Pisolithus microcarpus 441 TaxID=765257 RepID=A0A0C9ZHF5_9AGAM|nr:hypothetical protein PISMIDRAFT_107636 [Pisolithus microcarpus 441]